MKYEIDIEGLPEGWKPVAFRLPKKSEYFLKCEQIDVAMDDAFLTEYIIVEKIKPSRIILEETGEFRQAKTYEWIENGCGIIERWMSCENSSSKYKIWRPVKEGE